VSTLLRGGLAEVATSEGFAGVVGIPCGFAGFGAAATGGFAPAGGGGFGAAAMIGSGGGFGGGGFGGGGFASTLGAVGLAGVVAPADF
jgi:hypothetical protein